MRLYRICRKKYAPVTYHVYSGGLPLRIMFPYHSTLLIVHVSIIMSNCVIHIYPFALARCHFTFPRCHFSCIICHVSIHLSSFLRLIFQISFQVVRFSMCMSYLLFYICHYTFVVAQFTVTMCHVSFAIVDFSCRICHCSLLLKWRGLAHLLRTCWADAGHL